jgi:hypothetical protein
VTVGSCELGDLARVGLGFKSLQNGFFYLTQDSMDRFGIEEFFVRPIVLLKDLTGGQFIQEATFSGRLFYCSRAETDLRGTGALRYIRAMSDKPAAEKRQGRRVTTIRDALEQQGSGPWYAPKAVPHESHIWIRKAFDSNYSPFLFGHAVALDQRCNFIQPHEGTDWRMLAAVVTSSLFALSLEVHGAASMGAGALEVATSKLREVRVPDIRALSRKELSELVGNGERVWRQDKPVDWRRVNEPGRFLQELDQWLLDRMGHRVSRERLYSDLRQTCRARFLLSEDKRKALKKSQVQDIESVAKTVASSVRQLVEGKRFPEAFVSTGPTLQLDFRGTDKLGVEISPLFSETHLVVRDLAREAILAEGMYPREVAEVIVRALLMGRRNFDVPADALVARSVLAEFKGWFSNIHDRIEEGFRASALGTRFETELRRVVMAMLGIDARVEIPVLFGRFEIGSTYRDS